MPTYNLTRDALSRIAISVSNLFDQNATYSEKTATDGKLKVIVIRNPAGNGTPYASLRFPGDLLDRYDALGAGDRAKVENNMISTVRLQMPEYQSQFRAGVLSAQDGYPIELDDSIFDGV